MKRHDLPTDDLRAEYHRADLGKLVRGKYASRVAKASNVVVIDQALTKAFPNSEAVNAALRGFAPVGHRRRQGQARRQKNSTWQGRSLSRQP